MKRPSICLWKDLTGCDVERLEKAESAQEAYRVLSRMVPPEVSVSTPRASALLDLYYYTTRFCRESGFTREQTSCLITIVREMHSTCVETSLGNVEECFQYFQELLLCHAVHRPPFSAAIFSQQQIQRIADYFINTYFRHFKLYKLVFTPQVHLDLSISYDSEPQQDPEANKMAGGEDGASAADGGTEAESNEEAGTLADQSQQS